MLASSYNLLPSVHIPPAAQFDIYYNIAGFQVSQTSILQSASEAYRFSYQLTYLIGN